MKTIQSAVAASEGVDNTPSEETYAISVGSDPREALRTDLTRIDRVLHQAVYERIRAATTLV